MPRTIAKKDVPFSGKINQFISLYVHTEDLSRAAKMCGLTVEHAQRLYARKGIRQVIDARLELVHNAQAKLVAKYKTADVGFLDDQLVKAVKKGAEKGMVAALELGYKRAGMFRDGEFIGAPAANANAQANPLIFRVERTVTRTEQVTERQEIEGANQHPSLPAPVEILRY